LKKRSGEEVGIRKTGRVCIRRSVRRERLAKTKKVCSGGREGWQGQSRSAKTQRIEMEASKVPGEWSHARNER